MFLPYPIVENLCSFQSRMARFRFIDVVDGEAGAGSWLNCQVEVARNGTGECIARTR